MTKRYRRLCAEIVVDNVHYLPTGPFHSPHPLQMPTGASDPPMYLLIWRCHKVHKGTPVCTNEDARCCTPGLAKCRAFPLHKRRKGRFSKHQTARHRAPGFQPTYKPGPILDQARTGGAAAWQIFSEPM